MTIERITTNPLIMGGKPCIKGTRVTVSVLLRLLASGRDTNEIVDAYPYLTAADIQAALAYAAWRVGEA